MVISPFWFSSVNQILYQTCVDDINIQMIQININGLPLFKSSNTQFWPILGRLVDPPPFFGGGTFHNCSLFRKSKDKWCQFFFTSFSVRIKRAWECFACSWSWQTFPGSSILYYLWYSSLGIYLVGQRS